MGIEQLRPPRPVFEIRPRPRPLVILSLAECRQAAVGDGRTRTDRLCAVDVGLPVAWVVVRTRHLDLRTVTAFEMVTLAVGLARRKLE